MDAVLENLIRTLYRMRIEKRENLPLISLVAKEMEGSFVFNELVAATLELPDAADYFIRSGSNRVGLSASGLVLGEQLAVTPRPQSEMEKIAAMVKRYASKQRNQILEIQTIVPLTKSKRHHLHAIGVDLEESVVSNDTPVQILRKGSRLVYGHVVGQEPDDNLLYVALNERLSAEDLPAKLSIDRAFLIRALAEAIAQKTERPARAEAMFEQEPQGVPIYHADSVVVAEMLARFRTPWTRFLWGPPGAGKTYALGHFIGQLLKDKPESRILLLAPSNQAADTALAQFVAQIQVSQLAYLLNAHRILRFGYPRRPEILERPELLGAAAEKTKSLEIRRVADEIRRLMEKKGAEELVAGKRIQLLELQEELKEITKQHLAQCQVVATTTTLAYMPSSPIATLPWDTVVVDEVTMVPPATCLYLCGLAQKRVLFAGDPRQLGPVYRQAETFTAEEHRWLGQDIYQFAGLSETVGDRREIKITDRRLARITRQRRCAPPIWQRVAHLYEGVECQVDQQRIQHLPNHPPGRGSSFLLSDLSKHADASCSLIGSSWQNPFAAQKALDMVIQMIQHANQKHKPISIAIITPYRAQVKLLRHLIREQHNQLNLKTSTLEVGTIHQFQGSEADLVIFDMVDGPGRTKLGRLLEGDAGVRLVNVAITRARGKVILLANIKWYLQCVTQAQNPLLWDILHRAERI